MKCKLSVHIESWPIQAPFRINGTTWEKSELVVCEIERDGVGGRGEGVGMYYSDETPASMRAQITRYEAGQVYAPSNGFWGKSCVS
jgi:L-Ala-D/L-Glu epimerase